MFNEEIKLANTIGIMAHKNPDGDALGSVLAMGNFIRNEFGKEPTLIHEGVIPDNLRFISNDWWLKKAEEVKNVVYDLLFILDFGNLTNSMDTEARAIFDNAKFKIKIDHHQNSTPFADINIERSEPATCKIIADIATENNWKITPEIAKYLYTGIFTDTGGFIHDYTTPDTVRIAARLMECGANQSEIARKISEKNKETFANNVETLARTLFSDDNKIGFTTFSVKKINENDRPHRETSWMHIQILAVKDTEASAVFKEVDDGVIWVSMRSKTKPINSFAEQLGGGGHLLASAFTFNGTMAQAVATIIPKLQTFLNESI